MQAEKWCCVELIEKSKAFFNKNVRFFIFKIDRQWCCDVSSCRKFFFLNWCKYYQCKHVFLNFKVFFVRIHLTIRHDSNSQNKAKCKQLGGVQSKDVFKNDNLCSIPISIIKKFVIFIGILMKFFAAQMHVEAIRDLPFIRNFSQPGKSSIYGHNASEFSRIWVNFLKKFSFWKYIMY